MSEKILVTRTSMPEFDEYIDEIRDMWDTHWITNMGTKHNRLQSELKEYLKVEDVSLFCNGHMALELCIQAMKLTGEVITTPFTFASTTHAIVRNNLEPVFCDIEPVTYTIDVEKIEELITDKTSAIIPVHVYGSICNIEAIDNIAKKYNLKVIYDAAHAFGVSYKGNGIGVFGDASIFSFHATKVYHTIEGGAVCFSDPDIGLYLARLKNFGIRGQELVDYVGANAKMNEFQAAMGLCNLRHIDTEIRKRKEVYKCYCEQLDNLEGITILHYREDVVSNYAYFPIVINEKIFGSLRNEVYNKLVEHDIYTRKYFYPLTNAFDCFHGKYNPDKTPVAQNISQCVLTLPIYSELHLKDVVRICDIIKDMKSM